MQRSCFTACVPFTGAQANLFRRAEMNFKFTLGQKVKRNPDAFKREGKPVPTRIGTIIGDAGGKGYRVDWHTGDFTYCYLAKELVPAK
jgi:hypothetical protein